MCYLKKINKFQRILFFKYCLLKISFINKTILNNYFLLINLKINCHIIYIHLLNNICIIYILN